MQQLTERGIESQSVQEAAAAIGSAAADESKETDMLYNSAKLNERHRGNGRRGPQGFSLIELVIVVVIIGIIAAIAIPRMSRGSKGAADSALAGNLSVLRNAIDMFASEHDGVLPSAASFEAQMTGYTKIDGTDPNPAKDTAGGRIYGPYLRQVPPLPVGTAAQKGSTGVAAAAAAGVGWIYDETKGNIAPNVSNTATDSAGNLYSSY